MLYQWVFPETGDEAAIERIVQDFKIHPVIAGILQKRGIVTKSAIQKYFNPDLDNLYDPFLLSGMDKAVDRLMKALREGEHIVIYGDYDVDGVTSVSILYDSLFKLGGKVSFFIPDRLKEGYGLSKQGIGKALKRNSSLIITVDCGVTAIEEIDYANRFGIDVIVCDHHEQGDGLPNAVAVLNPKLKDSKYPFKELAGCGVAYKLLQALETRLDYPGELARQYLDLVAIGTSADIVQLCDENRILVYHGLELINTRPRNGILALMESCGLRNRELTVSAIVFTLAPRINAVGRISNAKKAVHLLTTDSLQQGRNIAQILELENKTRKGIDETTLREAETLLKETIDTQENRILVLAKKNWHLGVIGIVASRLMEKYHRPAVLISVQNGIGKGSARSTTAFNVYNAFSSLSDLLESFGGHRFAAGLTILPENIQLFKQKLNKLALQEIEQDEMISRLDIDAYIDLNQINAYFLQGLKKLAPFGPGNLRPVFASNNLELFGSTQIVGNNHLKLKVKQEGFVIDAIGYNLGSFAPELKEHNSRFNCAYVIEENKWSGQMTVQLRIKDFEVL